MRGESYMFGKQVIPSIEILTCDFLETFVAVTTFICINNWSCYFQLFSDCKLYPDYSRVPNDSSQFGESSAFSNVHSIPSGSILSSKLMCHWIDSKL